ncbi:MAG: hypothetical protein AB1414_13160 [bacterium]
MILRQKDNMGKRNLSVFIDTMTPIIVTWSYHRCGNPQCKRC